VGERLRGEAVQREIIIQQLQMQFMQATSAREMSFTGNSIRCCSSKAKSADGGSLSLCKNDFEPQ
jgi:hypothetical protein